MIEARGRCLCGKVEIQARSMAANVGACHCETCRKWTGGPLMTVECEDAVTFSGIESITVYSSSEWAERGFCSCCGTKLFYMLKENGYYIVPVGLFDTEIAFCFDHEIFIEAKPRYYCFANDTRKMTGEEVYALFSGG